MEQWSSIAEAGRRIHKEFNRDEAQGENFYDRNFALLRAGFAACLAFQALACVDRTGEVLLTLQRDDWQEVFEDSDWWMEGARVLRFDFFDDLRKGGVPLRNHLKVEGYSLLVIPFVVRERLRCFPVLLDEGALRNWSVSGLWKDAAGIEFFCRAASIEGKGAVDLSSLVANPIAPCGVLTRRFYDHVVLALGSHSLAPFLEHAGARRDYLALASRKLLSQRVALDEAGFLVLVLQRIWREKRTVAALDVAGDLICDCLQAVFLCKSLTGARAVDILFGLVCDSSEMVKAGLRELTRMCCEGEAAARVRLIHQIEETGYLGCFAQSMLFAWTGQGVDQTNAQSPDRHRHMTLKRSGANYVIGETIEKEENDMFEFKAVQQTANIVVHIARICSKYVPAFLNSGGGRLMFGIEDDGKVVGVPLDRSQRDAIRLAIDSLIVEPDCSHLIELVLSPVIGSAVERYVVEVCISGGEPGVLYCTRAGEHFVRKNSAVYMLKGSSLMSFVSQKLRLAQGCPVHLGEQLKYVCSCKAAEYVCSICLLEGTHMGHTYVKQHDLDFK